MPIGGSSYPYSPRCQSGGQASEPAPFAPVAPENLPSSARLLHNILRVTYLLTFSTYGTHLPGDARGSHDRHTGPRGQAQRLEDYALSVMRERPFELNDPADRELVHDSIAATCAQKEWPLEALHVRTTHVHLVLATDGPPERALQACKAFATRALKGTHPEREHFWTRSGNIRRLPDRQSLESAIRYVRDGQGQPL